jgi:hypothetical protein
MCYAIIKNKCCPHIKIKAWARAVIRFLSVHTCRSMKCACVFVSRCGRHSRAEHSFVRANRTPRALCVIAQDSNVAERSAATFTFVRRGLWRAQLTNTRLLVGHIKWEGTLSSCLLCMRGQGNMVWQIQDMCSFHVIRLRDNCESVQPAATCNDICIIW